ncbi:hypothetical protein ACS0TY_009944 [Phlomoides rotata]
MSSKKPSLPKLLCEISRIITTHPLHFLSLSALFLFPISFLTTFYPPINFYPTSLPIPSIYNQFLPTPDSEKAELPPAPKPHIQILLLYILLLVLFNTCAISSITRTTINALQDHPVQFVGSLKSVPISFFPILGTNLVSTIINELIVFASSFCTILPYIVLTLLGFNMNYPSIYSTVFLFLTVALTAAVEFYIVLQWCLMYPIVVMESMWGFAPLRRSSYLVNGMRRIVFLMMMLLRIPSLIVSIWYTNLMANVNQGRTGWVLVHMLLYAGFITMLSLYNIVADTVLFAYCKELHGETVPRIEEKSGGEYVKVPLDVV